MLPQTLGTSPTTLPTPNMGPRTVRTKCTRVMLPQTLGTSPTTGPTPSMGPRTVRTKCTTKCTRTTLAQKEITAPTTVHMQGTDATPRVASTQGTPSTVPATAPT
jgi:hypothetical protein